MKKSILAIAFATFGLTAHAQVTTLYGNGTASYSVSNTTADSVFCSFNMPYGSAFDSKGNLWITDQGNNYIEMVGSGKYQLREGYAPGGFNDGASIGQNGGLTYLPAGIVVVPGKTSANDQIYLCDGGNNAIRKVDSFVNISNAQNMTTVSGGGKKNGGLGKSGFTNGSGTTALFNNPAGIGYVPDASGGYLIVADLGNNAVRKVSLHKSDYGTTSTITTDIQNPTGIFVDGSNNIYVASASAGIQEISSSGTVSTIASGSYFEAPTSLAINGTDMYIADNCHIAYFNLKDPASGTNPSILAGDPADTNCAFEDGTDDQALFNGIATITLSPDKTYLVVADAMNNRFRKVILPPPGSVGFKHASSVSGTFNVYPNPVSGHVFVNNQVSGNADISLVTMTGKLMYRKSTIINAGEPYDVSIENLPSGVYVLEITSESGVYNNKIIIR